jgi:hypothetical protein
VQLQNLQIAPEFGGYSTPESVVLILADFFAEFAISQGRRVNPAAALSIWRRLSCTNSSQMGIVLKIVIRSGRQLDFDVES